MEAFSKPHQRKEKMQRWMVLKMGRIERSGAAIAPTLLGSPRFPENKNMSCVRLQTDFQLCQCFSSAAGPGNKLASFPVFKLLTLKKNFPFMADSQPPPPPFPLWKIRKSSISPLFLNWKRRIICSATCLKRSDHWPSLFAALKCDTVNVFRL